MRGVIFIVIAHSIPSTIFMIMSFACDLKYMG